MQKVPPVDKGGELKAAAKALDLVRKNLSKLPEDWQKWVVESVTGQLPIKDETQAPAAKPVPVKASA